MLYVSARYFSDLEYVANYVLVRSKMFCVKISDSSISTEVECSESAIFTSAEAEIVSESLFCDLNDTSTEVASFPVIKNSAEADIQSQDSVCKSNFISTEVVRSCEATNTSAEAENDNLEVNSDICNINSKSDNSFYFGHLNVNGLLAKHRDTVKLDYVLGMLSDLDLPILAINEHRIPSHAVRPGPNNNSLLTRSEDIFSTDNYLFFGSHRDKDAGVRGFLSEVT